MSHYIPDRQAAFNLLRQYTKTDGLIRHALAVEAVMGHFAEKFGRDVEKWKIIGLVHDLDYEMYPEKKRKKCVEIFEENQWPEEYIRAVVSHGWGLCADVEPLSLMEKTLYAVDELTGLVASAALVRPSKSILDIKAKSVKKKFKSKAFAAGVDRNVILKGCELLDMELGELITEVIMGMRPVAEEIGLKGQV